MISWAKAVDATVNDDIGLIKHNSEYVGGDGVHLTPKGYEKLVDTVISALVNDKEDSNTGKEVDACCDEGNAPVSTSVDITGIHRRTSRSSSWKFNARIWWWYRKSST